MTTYTLPERVRVDLRADGVDLSGEFGPGDVELAPAVAELLTAQGLATPAKAKAPKTPRTPDTNTHTED